MDTTEKLGWFVVIVGLLLAVATLIIDPILDKADEVKDDVTNIEFTTSSTSNYHNYNNMDAFVEAVLNDALRSA